MRGRGIGTARGRATIMRANGALSFLSLRGLAVLIDLLSSFSSSWPWRPCCSWYQAMRVVPIDLMSKCPPLLSVSVVFVLTTRESTPDFSQCKEPCLQTSLCSGLSHDAGSWGQMRAFSASISISSMMGRCFDVLHDSLLLCFLRVLLSTERCGVLENDVPSLSNRESVILVLQESLRYNLQHGIHAGEIKLRNFHKSSHRESRIPSNLTGVQYVRVAQTQASLFLSGVEHLLSEVQEYPTERLRSTKISM